MIPEKRDDMKKIVVLTGAGISAESGIKTFRDANGLWNSYRIEEVASPVAWANNPQLVLDFYNLRRKQLYEVGPNAAHHALVDLESCFDVQVITQNVDDLHERAGSTKVLHLHGELTKVRSTADPGLVFRLDGWELNMGDLCPRGSQLRPHIVWFGEPVPNIMMATTLVRNADILMVVGTSLQVYPAAGLLTYAPYHIPKYLIDPKAEAGSAIQNLHTIREKAGTGVPKLVEKLKNKNRCSAPDDDRCR